MDRRQRECEAERDLRHGGANHRAVQCELPHDHGQGEPSEEERDGQLDEEEACQTMIAIRRSSRAHQGGSRVQSVPVGSVDILRFGRSKSGCTDCLW